ncbi:S41 family peptidase [Deinococcus budaensis]|uniref:Carboxyl-terminal processing protease n=1 Tax=Deinococcus budaensis TaxID=1665626 RepID=A0A7W8GI79_9DEIO|nr:S41 family peptidase [Deinococcus budaensis]MBB5235636.1 carboxyl-terminal processing protease [Deinococcus budaensis]
MNVTPRRTPASGLSVFLVAASLLGSGLLGSGTLAQSVSSPFQAPLAPPSAAPASPAQQAFDQVNRLLQGEYGGLSTVDRAALAREYQARLDAVCAPAPTTCPEARAYPVIEAELTALGDEHSFFQTPEDFAEFVASATGGNRRQFGVKLAPLDGQNRVVLEVVPQSAAEEAGLTRGDVLLTLDGQPYTYEALRAARLAGRAITLGVQRAGQPAAPPLTVTLTSRDSSTRDLPRLSFTGAPAPGAAVAAPAPAGNVAVLRIPTFLSGGGIAQRVHELVAEARLRGAQGLIVDLRGNTGGSLAECDSSVSAFVPSFTRVARSAEGNSRTLVSRGSRLEDGRSVGSVRNPQLWTGPLAVLVDKGSASCSEFFAYEVQYARRGPVIGESTAGVGNTATRIFPVGDAALQLTILNYIKPDGQPYPERVQPDQQRDQTEEDLRSLTRGQDTLLALGVQALVTAPTITQDRARP